MEIKILLPALSPTMTEGNLTKWFVKKGDLIKAGEIIAEIETDKATMEVEAVDEGIITELLFKAGSQSIPVNSPIAILSTENNKSDENNSKNNETNHKKIKSETLDKIKKEKINISENHLEDNIISRWQYNHNAPIY